MHRNQDYTYLSFMKHSGLVFRLLLLLTAIVSVKAATPTHYVFFLHNRFTELFDSSAAHPVYGKSEYDAILHRFRSAGFKVISERRKSPTDVRAYARKVCQQILELRNKDSVNATFTVVGTSMGGYIAQYVSTYLGLSDINYVFIGSYMHADIAAMPDILLSGNVLSIYDVSDTLGVSMQQRIEAAGKRVTRFKEVALHTGLGHGFLYHPNEAWIRPAMQWCRSFYGNLTSQTLTDSLDAIARDTGTLPFNGMMLVQDGKEIIIKSQLSTYKTEEQVMYLQSPFVIGSVSKQFTAVMILQALDEGLLRLEDPIHHYLPGLKQSWADSVTILHLLTHMHGIVWWDIPLAFRPGTRMDYENGNGIGYLLLSQIIEAVRHTGFAKVSANLFAQCGMKNTRYPDKEQMKNVYHGYEIDKKGNLIPTLEIEPERVPSGGFISTSEDLCKWNYALHHGKLLKPETYQRMITPHPGAIREHQVWGRTYYGLGTTVSMEREYVQVGQTGYAPGYACMNYYFPHKDVSVIMLQMVIRDADPLADAYRRHQRLLHLVQHELKGGKE